MSADKLRTVHLMGRELLFGELMPKSLQKSKLYNEHYNGIIAARINAYFDQLKKFRVENKEQILSRMKNVLNYATNKNAHVEVLYELFRNDMLFGKHDLANSPKVVMSFLDKTFSLVWKTLGVQLYR